MQNMGLLYAFFRCTVKIPRKISPIFTGDGVRAPPEGRFPPLWKGALLSTVLRRNDPRTEKTAALMRGGLFMCFYPLAGTAYLSYISTSFCRCSKRALASSSLRWNSTSARSGNSRVRRE